MQKKRQLDVDGIEIVIQGIALGNPWIDPPNQYNPAEYAHGLGILSKGQVNKLKDQERQCRALLKEGKLNNKVCMAILDNVIDSSAISKTGVQKMVMYDIRKYASDGRAFPPGHQMVEAYLNKAEVRKAIHATKSPNRFVECADPPYYALVHQDGKGVLNELRYLLDNNIPILIYSGQYDLVCNHINIEQVLDQLEWSGQQEWKSRTPGIWMMGNKPVGYVRKAKSLQSLTGKSFSTLVCGISIISIYTM
jgi:carboxypeptidase D